MISPIAVKSTSVLIVLASFLACGSAAAQQSSTLTVGGRIAPAACTMTVNGSIDYGEISASALNPDKDKKLDRKNVKNVLTIACPAPKKIVLTFSDNRQASAGGNTAEIGTAEGGHFDTAKNGMGLGYDGSQNKLG